MTDPGYEGWIHVNPKGNPLLVACTRMHFIRRQHWLIRFAISWITVGFQSRNASETSGISLPIRFLPGS